MPKFDRSLGSSKREQGIVTPKMPVYVKTDKLIGRILMARFCARAWDALSERVKLQVNYAKMNREQKLEARIMGYNPYK